MKGALNFKENFQGVRWEQTEIYLLFKLSRVLTSTAHGDGTQAPSEPPILASQVTTISAQRFLTTKKQGLVVQMVLVSHHHEL